MALKIHNTAEVSDQAIIGENTVVWHYCQVREGAIIGKNCSLGKNVYIGPNVIIGNNVRIQNNVSIFEGVTIEDNVFIGPHTVFANDKYPRAVNKDGLPKNKNDWEIGKILIKRGASIGANSTILPDLVIGNYVMIGAGSVVTKDFPDFSMGFGNPAMIKGKVNKNGELIV